MGGHPQKVSASKKVGGPPIARLAVLRYRHAVQIPDALRSSVLQRMRRMDRAARAVLMRAAVIGRRFSVSLLTETVSCSESKVRAALQAACALQLVGAENPPSDFYMFRHALTRDIIYAELLSVRVRSFHLKIARALERAHTTGDAQLEDLAYHFWAAGDVARAVGYNELAGDNALAVQAQGDARTYYIRARSLLEIDATAYDRLTAKLRAMDEP